MSPDRAVYDVEAAVIGQFSYVIVDVGLHDVNILIKPKVSMAVNRQ